MRHPVRARFPRLDQVAVEWRGRAIPVPCLFRDGTGGPAVLFVHGLGGAKENFLAALQSPSLADCTLVCFDLPGTGLALHDQDAGLDVSGLAELTHALAGRLLPGPYFLAGASMGGLITLLQLRRHGVGRVQGLICLEGNLAAEDCLFSRRAVSHSLESFADTVFEEIISELSGSPRMGDRVIAQNLVWNIDVRAYHAYSFETVAESDSGRLLEEFLRLPVPRLFLHGEANRTLSYLDRLRRGDVVVREIPASGHFFFYDNPEVTFNTIGAFVHSPGHRAPALLPKA